MKNTVLGKIVDEQHQLQQIAAQIHQLQQHLNADPPPTPEQVALIHASIANLQGVLAKADQKRADLIKKIEAITGRRLLTYFSLWGSINDRDSKIIEDFLFLNKVSEFDILIDSGGGFTDAAEKMIKICRLRTGGDEKFNFRTIVVNRAKSAATLFALGSSKILLSKTAELGPVDPQIVVFAPNGDQVRDSAHQIFYGAKKYTENANGFFRFRKDGDLLLLSKYDPIAIKRAEVAINHTNDIIAKRIYTNPNLTKGYTETNSEKVKDELKVFTDHNSSHSHGRPIYYEDIKNCGFCTNKFIQKLDDYLVNDAGLSAEKAQELEGLLWELTIRSLEVVRQSSEPVIDGAGNIVGNNQIAQKLFESSGGLILTKDPL